jgi:hypothetical protein
VAEALQFAGGAEAGESGAYDDGAEYVSMVS